MFNLNIHLQIPVADRSRHMKDLMDLVTDLMLSLFAPIQESSASWLDSCIPHLSEIILLEDTPSIQMEVGVLVREFPDIR